MGDPISPLTDDTATERNAVKREGYRHEDFERELAALLNRFSVENMSDTPDFVLAAYLCGCLENFHAATHRRLSWQQPDPAATANYSGRLDPRWRDYEEKP